MHLGELVPKSDRVENQVTVSLVVQGIWITSINLDQRR